MNDARRPLHVALPEPGVVVFGEREIAESLPGFAVVVVDRKGEAAGAHPGGIERRNGDRRQTPGYGKPFMIIKFRTMRQDAEKHTGPVWATKRDPRITRLGAFLRATRIDELPQLFNILTGDMSLVGPWP